jgi:hypothetical protein
MTDTTTLAALETRLAKLERRNRLLVVTLAAASAIGIFTAAKTASQSASFSEVRADRFVLLDQTGKEVGVWSTSNGKSPSLAMGSSDLKRIELYENVNENANGREVFGNLTLRGSQGQEIFVNTTIVGPHIELHGRKIDRPKRSLARISSDTNGQIQLSNSLGSFLWLSSSEDSRNPAIGYSWRNRKPWQWSFTMYDVTFNGAKLNLNDRDGKPILVLPDQFSSKSVYSPPQKRFPLFGPRR